MIKSQLITFFFYQKRCIERNVLQEKQPKSEEIFTIYCDNDENIPDCNNDMINDSEQFHSVQTVIVLIKKEKIKDGRF